MPGIGDDVVALGEHPGERELAGGDALLGGDLLDPLDQLQVALEVLALEARVDAAEVVLGQVVDASWKRPVRKPRPSGL